MQKRLLAAARIKEQIEKSQRKWLFCSILKENMILVIKENLLGATDNKKGEQRLTGNKKKF